MTREEVIARLKEIDIRDALQEDYDALYVAIEALEQKPCDYYDTSNKTCRRSEVPKEPCEDAISRQYLLDNCVIDKVTMPYVSVSKVENAPSVAPQPKIGHWISHSEHCRMNNLRPSGLECYFWCSECACGVNYKYFHMLGYNYCPNCGAKMDAESEDKE